MRCASDTACVPRARFTRFSGGRDPFGATRDALPPEVYAAAWNADDVLTLDEAVAKVAELRETAATLGGTDGDART